MFFAPYGRHDGAVLSAKFSPHTLWVCEPQNSKFEIYKYPAEEWILQRHGIPNTMSSYGRMSSQDTRLLGGGVIFRFFNVPSNYTSDAKSFWRSMSGTDLLYDHADYSSLVELGLHPPPRRVGKVPGLFSVFVSA